MPFEKVRPTHARAFVAQLVSAGLAPSTIANIVNTASQVFDQAVVDGFLGKSPFIGVSLPPEGQREEMHFLSPEKVERLATAINERYRVAVYTAAYTGLRSNEQWALKVGRVKLLAGTLDVVEALAHGVVAKIDQHSDRLLLVRAARVAEGDLALGSMSLGTVSRLN